MQKQFTVTRKSQLSSLIMANMDDSENDVSALQSDLDSVMQWSERNNMALHKDRGGGG